MVVNYRLHIAENLTYLKLSNVDEFEFGELLIIAGQHLVFPGSLVGNH